MTNGNMAVELKDEELEKASGGNTGIIPQGGIAFQNYDILQPEHYYSHEENFSDVVYVYTTTTGLEYTRENFVIDASTNSWWSVNKSSGSHHPIENATGFMTYYKYRLNV